MFKNVLNNKRGSVEIIVWISILMILSVILFLFRNSILTMFDSTLNMVSNSAIEEQYETNEKQYESNIEDKKPVRDEDTTTITTETNKNNLWEEIKVEVIAGTIVSILCFGAGQLYAKFKYKKEMNIDDRLKTLNLNKYDI